MSTAEVTVFQPISAIPSYVNNALTPRTNLFINHWLVTGNGTESARLAGFPGDDNCLAACASRLLRSAKVQSEIRRLLGKHIASPEEVIVGLTNHARGDLAEVLEPDGSFNLQEAKRRGVSKLLKKLKVKTRYEKDADGNVVPIVEQEFELHDAQAAMVHLGRVHKLFVDRVEVKDETVEPDSLSPLKLLCKQLTGTDLTDEQAREILDRSFKRLENSQNP